MVIQGIFHEIDQINSFLVQSCLAHEIDLFRPSGASVHRIWKGDHVYYLLVLKNVVPGIGIVGVLFVAVHVSQNHRLESY